jgi:hypothetical protein
MNGADSGEVSGTVRFLARTGVAPTALLSIIAA